jgi:hypothetical protein
VEPAPAKPPKDHAYRLTYMDLRLLRQLRIDPEVPEAL